LPFPLHPRRRAARLRGKGKLLPDLDQEKIQTAPFPLSGGGQKFFHFLEPKEFVKTFREKKV
jgi:hypothetical protein